MRLASVVMPSTALAWLVATIAFSVTAGAHPLSPSLLELRE